MPRDAVAAVRHEISDGMEAALAALPEADRQRPGPGGSMKPRHDIVLQPLFQQYVCHPAMVGLAQTMLDAHVRIAQSGRRNIPSDAQVPDGEIGGFGPPEIRGELRREYHTDWPHDMEKGSAGSERLLSQSSDRRVFVTPSSPVVASDIRQPFPDICMALSCVWYMSDVDEAAGGTFGKPPDLPCF